MYLRKIWFKARYYRNTCSQNDLWWMSLESLVSNRCIKIHIFDFWTKARLKEKQVFTYFLCSSEKENNWSRQLPCSIWELDMLRLRWMKTNRDSRRKCSLERKQSMSIFKLKFSVSLQNSQSIKLNTALYIAGRLH